MRFLFIGWSVTLPALASRNRYVMFEHEWSFDRGLTPHLQRAHAGRTQDFGGYRHQRVCPSKMILGRSILTAGGVFCLLGFLSPPLPFVGSLTYATGYNDPTTLLVVAALFWLRHALGRCTKTMSNDTVEPTRALEGARGSR